MAWGVRYSQMETPGVPTALIGTDLDGQGFDPTSVAVMADWTNSEFSRIRWQFNQDKLASGSGSVDNQFTIQYLMSIGAHGFVPSNILKDSKDSQDESFSLFG